MELLLIKWEKSDTSGKCVVISNTSSKCVEIPFIRPPKAFVFIKQVITSNISSKCVETWKKYKTLVVEICGPIYDYNYIHHILKFLPFWSKSSSISFDISQSLATDLHRFLIASGIVPSYLGSHWGGYSDPTLASISKLENTKRRPKMAKPKWIYQ